MTVKNEKVKYKKILVVINGGLPIPYIKGGAIETLINLFIDSNEIEKKYEITVYSNYAKGVEDVISKYNNTSFKYINTNKISYKISYFIRGIFRRIFKLNINSAYTARFLKSVKKDINQYDLILVENYISCVHPISKIYHGKIVSHLHNDSIINAKYHDGAQIIDDCYKIFTVSDFIKRRVNSVKKSDKVEVVYNGIDQSLFKPDKNEKSILRKKYNLNENDIVFLFSGRVCEEKGIMPLSIAFSKVCEKYDNCKLLIVGVSFYSSTMKTKFIDQLKSNTENLNDKIIFSGYVSYKNMPQIYQMADILVVPSLFEEALSLTLVEGMSTQLPVIISDSGGMPEVVNKECAFVAKRDNIVDDLEKYMIKLIEDKELREQMGLEALKRSKEFSKEKYLEKFWYEINKILE